MRPQLIAALSVGSRVPSHFSGRVHSVYRRACNIELDDGTLITVLGCEQTNLPHGIRCELPEREVFQVWMRPGQAVAADASLFRAFPGEFALDLRGAALWRCRLRGFAMDSQAKASPRALSAAQRVLRQCTTGGGFVPLLLGDAARGSTLERAMQRRLREALPALSRASCALDCTAAARALEQLAGLGPGLTPSGDDFIVGYLAALHARSSRETLLRSFLAGLAGAVTRLAAAANLISRQFMLNAVEGEFSEALAQVVLAAGAFDERRLGDSAVRLVRVGHSSGADSLAGLLFGLCLPVASTPHHRVWMPVAT